MNTWCCVCFEPQTLTQVPLTPPLASSLWSAAITVYKRTRQRARTRQQPYIPTCTHTHIQCTAYPVQESLVPSHYCLCFFLLHSASLGNTQSPHESQHLHSHAPFKTAISWIKDKLQCIMVYITVMKAMNEISSQSLQGRAGLSSTESAGLYKSIVDLIIAHIVYTSHWCISVGQLVKLPHTHESD